MRVNQTITSTRTVAQNKYKDAPSITIVNGSNSTAVIIMIIATVVLLLIGLFLIGRFVYNKARQEHVSKEAADHITKKVQQKSKTIPHQTGGGVTPMNRSMADKSDQMQDVFEDQYDAHNDF